MLKGGERALGRFATQLAGEAADQHAHHHGDVQGATHAQGNAGHLGGRADRNDVAVAHRGETHESKIIDVKEIETQHYFILVMNIHWHGSEHHLVVGSDEAAGLNRFQGAQQQAFTDPSSR